MVVRNRLSMISSLITAARMFWLPSCTFPKWWSCTLHFYFSISVVFACFTDHLTECSDVRSQFTYKAILNYTFKNPVTGLSTHETSQEGLYSTNGRFEPEWGTVIHVRTEDNQTHGCSPPVNIPQERWVALIQRGSCPFRQKIHNAAVLKNASAVVVYNNERTKDNNQLAMQHNGQHGQYTMSLGPEIAKTSHEFDLKHIVDDAVSVFIPKELGDRIAQLVDNGTKVTLRITLGPQQSLGPPMMDRPSVLFVSISFIVLMIISLAWLVFYYIQRFRYAHAKERLSRRLMSAAKKAIAKMPARTLKNGDKETESDYDQCAVCIESYKVSDIVRILPCKHIFHKSCVDPWLIEQRSCPMCKMDILKALGLQVHCSRESINRMDEIASTSLAPHELEILHANSSSLDERSSGGGGPFAQIIQHHSPPHHPIVVEFHAIPHCTSRGWQGTSHFEIEDEQDSAERRETVHDSGSDIEEDTAANAGSKESNFKRTDSVDSLVTSQENAERQRLMEGCTEDTKSASQPDHQS